MHEDTERNIKASFAAQTMMTTLGATLQALDHGCAEIHAPILPGSKQQHGAAHAALTFAIGDSAAAYAALSVMPHGSEVLTTEMKINLIRPAVGEYLKRFAFNLGHELNAKRPQH